MRTEPDFLAFRFPHILSEDLGCLPKLSADSFSRDATLENKRDPYWNHVSDLSIGKFRSISDDRMSALRIDFTHMDLN